MVKECVHDYDIRFDVQFLASNVNVPNLNCINIIWIRQWLASSYQNVYEYLFNQKRLNLIKDNSKKRGC